MILDEIRNAKKNKDVAEESDSENLDEYFWLKFWKTRSGTVFRKEK